MERTGYDLPLDGTDEQRAQAAIALAIKLSREAGLCPGVAIMAATAEIGADPDVVYEHVLAAAFRTLGGG